MSQQNASNECRAFIAGFRTAVLATSSDDGSPHASYAPFVFSGPSFYVFVSNLAVHTRNLIFQKQKFLCLLKKLKRPVLFVKIFALR